MKLRFRDYPLEIREIGSDGEFTGYASVFDEINFYRERVLRGAFRKTIDKWSRRNRMPPLLWQHRSFEPIGPIRALEEHERGLFMHGQLLVDDVPRAREARALLKSKTINGLSVGFDVPDGGDEVDKEGIRNVSEIDLWEISVVTFQAGPSAEVDYVRDCFRDRLPTVREFEGFLRDAGFTRSQSAAIASRGLSALLRDAEGGKATEPVTGLDVRSLLDAVAQGIR